MARTDNNFIHNRPALTKRSIRYNIVKVLDKIKIKKRICQRSGCNRQIPSFKNSQSKYCSIYCRERIHREKRLAEKLKRLGKEKAWRGIRRIGLYNLHNNGK